MKLVLAMPPSINQTYGVSDSTMYKRKPVKNWEYTAGQQIMMQWRGAREPFKNRVMIGITWYYKVDRDIDAGIKVLLDLLEKQGIVRNDRQFRKIEYVDIFPDFDNPRVEIILNEMV